MAMTTQKLTDRQQRILRALTDEWELAYDIAQKAEVDNRAAGAVLTSLWNRDLIAAQWLPASGPARWRRVSR